MLNKSLLETEVGNIEIDRLFFTGSSWIADTPYGLFRLHWPYKDDKQTAEKIAELCVTLHLKKLGNIGIDVGKLASDYYYMRTKQ